MTRLIIDSADVESVAVTMRRAHETIAGLSLELQRGWDHAELNYDLDASLRAANPQPRVAQILTDLRNTQNEIVADIAELERVLEVLRADAATETRLWPVAQALGSLGWQTAGVRESIDTLGSWIRGIGGVGVLGSAAQHVAGWAGALARQWGAASPAVQPTDWVSRAAGGALDMFGRDVDQVMGAQASFTGEVEFDDDLSFSSFIDGLGGLFKSIWNRGKNLAKALKAYASELWDSAVNEISAIGDSVNKELGGLLARAQQLFQGPPSDFQNRLAEVANTDIQGALDKLTTRFAPTALGEITKMIPPEVLGLLEREGKLGAVLDLIEQHGPGVVTAAIGQLGLEAVDTILARFGEDGLKDMVTMFVDGKLATLQKALGSTKFGVLLQNLGPTGIDDLLERMSTAELSDVLDSLGAEELEQLAAAFGFKGAAGLVSLIQNGNFEQMMNQMGKDKLLYLIDRVGPKGLSKALATYTPEQIHNVMALINPGEVGKAFDDLIAGAGPEEFDKLVGYVLNKSGLAGYKKTGAFDTGFEEKFGASFATDEMYAEFEARIQARLSGSGSFEITSDGIELGGKVAVFFGADAAARAGFETGPVEGEGSALAAVGAGGEAAGAASIGAEGIDAKFSAEAFAGARARIDGRIGSDVLGVGGSAGVLAGIGAKLEGDVKVSWDEVSFDIDFGASLGLGAEFSFDMTFSPEELMDDAQAYIAEAGNEVLSFTENTVDQFVTQPFESAATFTSRLIPEIDIDIGWPF